jgi:peptide/nickel transport system ATP-binding protein
MALLDIRGLKTHFQTDGGWLHAVDGVDLQIDAGETVCVVGESGCGKSVTAKTVLRLIDMPPGKVVAGQVLWQGQDLLQLSDEAMRQVRAKQIAMIFQEPMTSLNPVYSVGAQVAESLRLHEGLSRKAAMDRAIEMLALVKIPTPERRAHDYPHQFSGGMRQRVMIALALACRPQLLIADEPTTALDVTVQAQILDLLQRQQVERFMAMVLVTHDLGVVAGRTDHIAVMYAGQIVEHAPTGELFANVLMPYTDALLHSIPKLSQPSHTRLQSIGGRPPDLINPPSGCRFAPRCPYVQPKCTSEMPPLQEAETPGHLYRCWFPVGTDAGREALAQNAALGIPAAVSLTQTLAEKPGGTA